MQVTARQGARCVVVRAEKASATNQVAKVFAAVALSAVVSMGAVDAASADVAGLTPCSESKAFAKQQKKEVKALEKRKKNVRSSTSCSTAVAIPPMPPLIVRRVQHKASLHYCSTLVPGAWFQEAFRTSLSTAVATR